MVNLCSAREIPDSSEMRNKLFILIGLILGSAAAALLMPRITAWIPYDYQVYVQGARLIRAGLDPHAALPYWYPLPITLFTTVPWSFLPDQFAWAFAFIPLGLLHLRYGKRAPLCWLFFPLLINVMYGQAEGWLLFPVFWILEDARGKASLGMLALMFKPAYAMLTMPYRVAQWIRDRRWRDLFTLLGLGGGMMGAAFLIDPAWHWHLIGGLARRGDNPELRARNMTIWAFVERGGMWFIPLGLCLIAGVLLGIAAWRAKETRAHLMLAVSLFTFPNGLNPVSSMMVLPFVETRNEILALVATSWLVAGLEVLTGGFGGFYLANVFVALALRVRRVKAGVP